MNHASTATLSLQSRAKALLWTPFVRRIRLTLVLALLGTVFPTLADPFVPGGLATRISTGNFILEQPTGLVVTASNDIYIGCNLFSGTGDVLKISPSGDVTRVAVFNSFIGGMTLDSNGRILGTIQSGGGSLFQLTDNGYSIIRTQVAPVAEQLVALGSDLYVTSFLNSTVVKVGSSGTVKANFAQVVNPLGITTNGTTLFVGESNPNKTTAVVSLDSTGNRTGISPAIPGRIVALTFNSFSGSIYAAIQNEGGTYARIEQFRNGGDTPFAWGFDDFPRDMAVAPNGDLLVTDATGLYRIPEVPEPAVPWLLVSGCGFLAVVGCHRRQKAHTLSPM